MNVENYQKAKDIRNKINEWEKFQQELKEDIINKSHYYSGAKPVIQLGESKEITQELIDKLDKRVEQEIAQLEIQFHKL